MAYERPFSVHRPGCLIFLVDQSGAMEEPFAPGRAGAGQCKMDVVAAALNHTLIEIGRRCIKGAEVRPRVFVAAIGYGGAHVGSILPSRIGGGPLVSITDLMENPLRVERRMRKEMDDAGNLCEVPVDFPVWLDGRADGATPMCEAIEFATRLVEDWIPSHQRSFPPIVINITDGIATDGDPRPAACALRSLMTEDGNVLLFNCHLNAISVRAVMLPSSRESLPQDPLCEMLFEMSSEIPETMLRSLVEMGVDVCNGARGLAYDADLDGLSRLLRLATRI